MNRTLDNLKKTGSMIKLIKIKCPICREVSELFLSIDPSVIILNCPECWSPLMYDKSEVHILSQQEMRKITAPSPQKNINKIFEKTLKKNLPHTDKASAMKSQPASMNQSPSIVPALPPPYTKSQKRITSDDVLNLRIELEQCTDVLEFIQHI